MKSKDDSSISAVNLPSSAAAYSTTAFYYYMYGRICSNGCLITESIPRSKSTDATMNRMFYYLATTAKEYT